MFAGTNYASVNYSEPTKIELEYASGGYLSVGLFSKFTLDIQPVTRRGDPDNSSRVAYYNVSMRYELLQTSANELAAMTGATMLNVITGYKITYSWGTVTFARASFAIYTTFAHTIDNEQGAGMMQASCDFSVAPSTIASIVSIT